MSDKLKTMYSADNTGDSPSKDTYMFASTGMLPVESVGSDIIAEVNKDEK